MYKRSSAWVFKPVAVGFNRLVMEHLKALPTPTVIQRSVGVHDPVNMLNHAVERSGKSELTEVREAFFDKWRANHRQGVASFPVGNVFSLKKEKRESEDVVSVDVGDEDGSYVCGRVSVSAHTGQGCGRRIDEVNSIQEGEGMMSPMWKKGVARSEHFDAVRHARPSAREVLL